MRATMRLRRSIRGQALTELAVCAAVLVPLFLLVPVVAKFGHANQMAQQAARNAAWTATVTDGYDEPDQAAQRRAALDRSFADADAPIRSTPPTTFPEEFDDPMLNTFSGRKLLLREDLQVPRGTNAGSPGFVDDAVALLPLSGFPPNRRGYYTAEVRLNYRNLQNRDGSRPAYLAPFDQLDVVQTRRAALLADAWNASGPRSGRRSVTDTVSPLVPTSYFPDIDGVCGPLGVMDQILPIVGALCNLKLGTVEPDVVPSDKLIDYPVQRR